MNAAFHPGNAVRLLKLEGRKDSFSRGHAFLLSRFGYPYLSHFTPFHIDFQGEKDHPLHAKRNPLLTENLCHLQRKK
jgi:hypothetical protein